jgi:phosphoribosyl-ATP pyrophosphohydrolase
MISELYDIIVERKMNPKGGSYTNKLLDGNVDALLQKVGEEAVEVILAAKGQGNRRLVEEVSDLFYHTLVVLVRQGVTLAEVEAELSRRHQTPKVS